MPRRPPPTQFTHGAILHACRPSCPLVVSRSLTSRFPVSPWIACVLWAVAEVRLLLPDGPESSWSVFNLVPAD